MGGTNSTGREEAAENDGRIPPDPRNRAGASRGDPRVQFTRRQGRPGAEGDGMSFFVGDLRGIPINMENLGEMFLSAIEEAQLERALAASREDYEMAPKGPPPTDDEVLQSLPEKCLDVDDIRDGNEHCAVCFEEQHCGDLALQLPCTHAFHKSCVIPWLKKHNTCPVCRLELNKFFEEQKKKLEDAKTEQTQGSEPSVPESVGRQQRLAERRREHEIQLEEQRRRMRELEEEERASRTRSGSVEAVSPEPALSSRSGDNVRSYSLSDGGNVQPEKRLRREDNCDDTIVNGTDDSTPATEDAAFQSRGNAQVPCGKDPSTFSVRELRSLLARIGLNEEADKAVEKGELVESLTQASLLDSLNKLPVRELRRRLRYMNIPSDSILDKRSLGELLCGSVSAILRDAACAETSTNGEGR